MVHQFNEESFFLPGISMMQTMNFRRAQFSYQSSKNSKDVFLFCTYSVCAIFLAIRIRVVNLNLLSCVNGQTRLRL
jgi:hypothetical protein